MGYWCPHRHDECPWLTREGTVLWCYNGVAGKGDERPSPARPSAIRQHTGSTLVTKKELEKIVGGIVSAVLLKSTEGQPDDYVPTASEEDAARTLVGLTLKANRTKLIDAVPQIGAMA